MKNFKSLRRAIKRGRARLIPMPLQMKMLIERKTGKGMCTNFGGKPEFRPKGWDLVASF